MGLKLNLGCGKHVLDGWENLDPRAGLDVRIREWKWNAPLPFPDGSAELILIQHSLMYCGAEDYDKNFLEIRRVLAVGGRIVVKEVDDRHCVWRGLGHASEDGVVASTTSEPKMMSILARNGFGNLAGDKAMLLGRYASVVTRLWKAKRSLNYFIVEGTRMT